MKSSLLYAPTLLMLLSWSVANGTTYAPKPRNEVVDKSEFIGVVRLVGGRQVEIDLEGKNQSCGGIYQGTVLDDLTSTRESVEFFSEQSLSIGGKYVLFLTSGDSSGQDMMSTNSFMMPALREEAEKRKKCEAAYNGPKAIRGLIGKFTTYRQIISGDQIVFELWVEYVRFGRSDDDDIANVKFDAENIRVSTNEGSSVLTPDELVADSMSMVTAKYPIAWLYESLMKWDDFRAAIIKEIAKARETNSNQTGETQ